jgi:hypothetical protein
MKKKNRCVVEIIRALIRPYKLKPETLFKNFLIATVKAGARQPFAPSK